MKRHCVQCGEELEEGATFCGRCGAVQPEQNGSACPHCGARNEQGAVYCQACGRRLDGAEAEEDAVAAEAVEAGDAPRGSQQTGGVDRGADIPQGNAPYVNSPYGSSPYGNRPYINDRQGPKKSTNTGVIIAAVSTAAALIAVIACLVIYFGGKRELEPSPTNSVVTQGPIPTVAPPTPTPVVINTPVPVTGYAPAPPPQPPTVPPVPTVAPAPTPAPHVPSSSYLTYTDTQYSFSCSYPSDFHTTVVDGDFYRYTVAAPDGTGSLYICATQNNNGRTPAIVRDNFVATYGGTIDFENSGSNWCVIRTYVNGMYHYGYFSLRDGMIRGFEMHFSGRYFDRYDKYVNDIYDSLSFY